MNDANVTPLGDRLVILGAGIGGSYTALMCAPYFAETVIIDRDAIPDTPEYRPGVPQSAHIHALLRAPLDVANEAVPGFEDALVAAGALSLTAGTRARYHEYGGWQVKRDLGFNVSAQSRVLVEHEIRRHALHQPGVTLRDEVELVDYMIVDGVTTGVLAKDSTGRIEIISADLVVDSTGRAGPILGLLEQHGYDGVRQDEMGVDISYTSAFFTRTESDEEAFGAIVRSNPPEVRSGVLWPIENGRWVVSLSGRFGDFPPADEEGFAEFARTLGDSLPYDTIQKAERVSDFSRFMIPRIYWRHYEDMKEFPERLIPIGDAVQAFNPVYGQGMAVASLHARELRDVLREIADGDCDLGDVSARMRPRVAGITQWAWDLTQPVD
ncbi:MAG: FAD-dependent monooxygenase, partial [Rhodococcus sp. (in: high G+C Gram-positive bacteria)]